MTSAITSLQEALDGANHERSRELIREALQYEEIHINEWLQTIHGLEGVQHVECNRDGSEVVWFDPDDHFAIEAALELAQNFGWSIKSVSFDGRSITFERPEVSLE
ncbi:hypothetical protein C5B86_19350 [Haloferax sp. Atlit-19N]|uniref:hypothetical protein n=1 Tax=Haloferax sp. Atlit-19N TaxID=2077201 RepID=UPI000E281E2A|nr:hypothetical protein [Haloferax sp. Atlit-19N]RDZ39370.1 hypothetical protein C5B86_19350 [Haloferax sp. Atlit-19N]